MHCCHAGARRASRWSDQPVSGAYRNRDGQMVTDETGMQVSHLKGIKFLKEIVIQCLIRKIRFRSPVTSCILETCVSDMMAQLERNSAMKTGRDSVRSGRPIR